MQTRRTFVLSTMAGAAASLLPAHGEELWEQILREAKALDADDPVFLGVERLPLDDKRWDQAKAFLASAPSNGTAFDVANYLDGNVAKEFRAEWPTAYANPLVVLLFEATNTEPAGDTTAWCAAFVSWCLEHAGQPSTHSAASKSYREFGDPVWVKGDALPGAAREGDLAVFRQLSDPSHGHVAFFLGMDPESKTRIRVLGGNQSDAIGVSRFRVDGDLELHSIRRVV